MSKHTRPGDTISFKEIWEKMKELMQTKREEEPRYPKNQNELAVYTEFPLYYKDEKTKTPTNEIKAYMYVLTCPICGREVKRSETFCGECGNKVII